MRVARHRRDGEGPRGQGQGQGQGLLKNLTTKTNVNSISPWRRLGLEPCPTKGQGSATLRCCARQIRAPGASSSAGPCLCHR